MIRKIAILRGSGKEKKYVTYGFEISDSASLLDVLELLRTGTVPGLVYRHSCHHGSCGTCAVRVNGKEVLACLCPVSSLYKDDPAAIPRLDPLAVLESAGDLAADPSLLFTAQPVHAGTLRKSEWRDGVPQKDIDDLQPVFPEPGEEAAMGNGPVRFEDCIECASCISACPVLRAGETQGRGTGDFMGPAALTAFHREYLKDSKQREVILDRIQKPDGVAACKRYIECSRVCPRAVYPAKHIEMARQELQKKLSH